jgi:hypothetical protein
MRSLVHRAAALLAGLVLTAHAAEASAQVAPEPAPLQVAASPSPPAVVAPRREANDGVFVALGATVGALALVDVSFAVYDGVQAGRGQVLPLGAAVAQGLIAAPQVLVFDTLHAVATSAFSEGSEDENLLAPLVLVPGLANTLTLNAALNSAPRSVPPGTLYAVSWALGFDMAFTIPAIVAAGQHRLLPRSFSAVEMALTAPQIAAASYGIVKDRQHLATYAPITAWSSALFVHGLVSAAIPRRDPAAASAPAESPKPPLMVPASIEVGPATIARGGGLQVSGRFF